MSRRHPRRTHGLQHGRAALWTMPLLIAIASLAGLTIGLIGDGAMDVAAWVALGVPVIAIGWSLMFMRR